MEKKGNRTFPGSTKPSTADTKKNQDVTNGKQWPRNSRRREPAAGCGFSSKTESSFRKPQPQCTKLLDKRPKPRGYYYGNASRTATACPVPPDDAELGSVFIPGSKKQSLNHLLNFSFPPYMPRESYGMTGAVPKGNAHSIATKKHKYNKEHFLQANCQFVVNDKGDYKMYMNNPDALVDWDFIEQVNVQVSEVPSCPICLYPPVAAKMTRCGHVYCWSCILHYLAYADKTWRKCPICYEAVHKKDLKSVVAMAHRVFNVNEIITFKLMKRPRGSLMAYPADITIKDESIVLNMQDENVEDIYSKLILANDSNILSIINRESSELQVEMMKEENIPEKCFIEEAVRLLEERKDALLGSFKTLDGSSTAEIKIKEGTCDLNNKSNTEAVLEQSFTELQINDGFQDEQTNSVAAQDLEVRQKNLATAKFHYFYQACDGQHMYLHAVNARMLEHTYGSLEHGPKTVRGKIVEKEGGSMTEELRKKLRYLQHLPVTCQFEVAEIQLKPPVVSKETLEHFHDQLEIRRKKRQRRAKDEKRREKRIDMDENKKIGKIPQPEIHLESHMQFPDFEEAKERIRNESECTNHSENVSECDLLSYFTPMQNESIHEDISRPSFAKMLTSEKKHQPTRPSPANLAAPVKLINVTGRNMSTVVTMHHSDSETEVESCEPVPDYRSNFGDAIADALKRAPNQDNASGLSLGSKKKRKKKQVLFTTNMACGDLKY